MPKKAKKELPLKVRWEFAHTPDAEALIEAAFDIIFSHMEEPRIDNLPLSAGSAAEDQDARGQLPLF